MLRIDLVDPTVWKEKLRAWFCIHKWRIKLWTNSEKCDHTIGETSLNSYTADSCKPWFQAVSCNVCFTYQNKNMSQKFLNYLDLCFLRPTKRRSRSNSCSLTWPPSFDHYNCIFCIYMYIFVCPTLLYFCVCMLWSFTRILPCCLEKILSKHVS